MTLTIHSMMIKNANVRMVSLQIHQRLANLASPSVKLALVLKSVRLVVKEESIHPTVPVKMLILLLKIWIKMDGEFVRLVMSSVQNVMGRKRTIVMDA